MKLGSNDWFNHGSPPTVNEQAVSECVCVCVCVCVWYVCAYVCVCVCVSGASPHSRFSAVGAATLESVRLNKTTHNDTPIDHTHSPGHRGVRISYDGW